MAKRIIDFDPAAFDFGDSLLFWDSSANGGLGATRRGDVADLAGIMAGQGMQADGGRLGLGGEISQNVEILISDNTNKSFWIADPNYEQSYIGIRVADAMDPSALRGVQIGSHSGESGDYSEMSILNGFAQLRSNQAVIETIDLHTYVDMFAGDGITARAYDGENGISEFNLREDGYLYLYATGLINLEGNSVELKSDYRTKIYNETTGNFFELASNRLYSEIYDSSGENAIVAAFGIFGDTGNIDISSVTGALNFTGNNITFYLGDDLLIEGGTGTIYAGFQQSLSPSGGRIQLDAYTADYSSVAGLFLWDGISTISADGPYGTFATVRALGEVGTVIIYAHDGLGFDSSRIQASSPIEYYTTSNGFESVFDTYDNMVVSSGWVKSKTQKQYMLAVANDVISPTTIVDSTYVPIQGSATLVEQSGVFTQVSGSSYSKSGSLKRFKAHFTASGTANPGTDVYVMLTTTENTGQIMKAKVSGSGSFVISALSILEIGDGLDFELKANGSVGNIIFENWQLILTEV